MRGYPSWMSRSISGSYDPATLKDVRGNNQEEQGSPGNEGGSSTRKDDPVPRSGKVTTSRRSNFAALVLLLLLSPLGDVACAKEKPEIIRLDAEYMDMLVKINVHWQSPNPVTVIRAIVGKEQKEFKVDEYDNRRNPDGYSGEAVIVVNAAPTAGVEGIPYVVQIEDDLRQKSEQVTGSAKTPAGLAGTGAVTSPGTAGTGAGAWSASGAWSATGAGPTPGSWTAGSAAGQGNGGLPPGATGVPYGGSSSAGDAWSKAQQGRPGELIDKTIGFISGSGKSTGSSASATGSPPPPVGTGGAGFPQTLQNENFAPGSKVSFASGLNPNDEVAVVLGPVDRPFKVAKILFLFGGSSGKGTVTLKISQDVGGASSGAVLFTESFEVQGADTALQEVDLAQMGGDVTVQGGSVRVSIQVQHAGLPGVGFDTSVNATPGRNWINRSGVWSDIKTAGIPGNGIIRVMVSP